MYKAEELILLEEKPRINDIDLYVLCDFYEILFYSKHENAVVHLGIDIDDEGIYFPRTFFVEKLGHGKAEDIYTINQTPVKVVKDRRIILL